MIRNQKLTRFGERLLGFGYPMTKNYANAHFLGHIYYAYILRYRNYSLRSYMKGFVEVTLEADLYLTEPSLRATGGQTCKKKTQEYVKNVTNAKNLHQTYTN